MDETWRPEPSPLGPWIEVSPGSFQVKDAAGKVLANRWSPAYSEKMAAARRAAAERKAGGSELGEMFVKATRPEATDAERQAAKEALLRALATEVTAGGARAVTAITQLGNTVGSWFAPREQAPVTLVTVDPSLLIWIEALWTEDPEHRAWLEDLEQKWTDDHGRPKAR